VLDVRICGKKKERKRNSLETGIYKPHSYRTFLKQDWKIDLENREKKDVKKSGISKFARNFLKLFLFQTTVTIF